MGQPMDRRALLTRGVRGAAGMAALGATGGTLLSACGGTPKGQPAPQKSPYGGSLTMATWSEVNSLSPPGARWDATGYLYGNAIFDTLVQIGADGKAHPYLAESVTPNADYTVWTIKVRPGILFHNGEVCDGAAVKNSMDAVRSGLITAEAVKPIEKTVLADAMTVEIHMSAPWVPFAPYLASQLGYICAPAMLKSKNQGATAPIGTGPFIFDTWNFNSSLTVKRNPHYWQKNPSYPGKTYPYLDEIIFKPITDNGERDTAMRANSIELMHTQYPQSVATFLHNPAYKVVEGVEPPGAEPDVDFIMFNCDKFPTNDIDVRRALIMATDPNQLREIYGANLVELVNGPFQKGSAYYTETAYPGFNPSAAKELVQKWQARNGGQDLTIQLNTITGAAYETIVTNLQTQWLNVGIKSVPGQIQFSTFLFDVVLGGYEAVTFEQFSATDPDQNYVWWSTDTYAPDGKISLNIARNRDDTIQQALETGRQSTDPAARVEAYQTVAKQLGTDLPYLWLGKTLWAAVSQPYVAGVDKQTLPDGTPGIGFDNGSFLVHQIRRNG
ncbi:MAG TPA: ABC transporter substrate-binding protein [Acidimicrobiales bacterium]|nr:ABC transporter substrate-binding protein [Acidimicrobiales bacterium]